MHTCKQLERDTISNIETVRRAQYMCYLKQDVMTDIELRADRNVEL